MMADTYKLVSGGEDIKIWEPPNLRLVQTFKPHSQGASSLAWSPNNNLLASTAPGDPVVVTYFKGTNQNSIELPNCEDETCVTFNSTSRHLLTGGKSKVLNLWDLKTKTVKKKVKIPKDAVSCLTFNWNDTNIVSGTTGGDIYLHSVSTTQTSAPLRLHNTQTIHSIRYSKFKKSTLGAVSDDGAMNIWDANAKKNVMSFCAQHSAPAMDIGFSPMNDMLVASAGLDKRIVFYDISGKKVIKEMMAESPLCSISFMQDGASFAVGSTRGKIYIHDLRSGSAPLHSTQAHKSSVQCLSFQLQPPKGSGNNSSSTLAEKFTSRSLSDSSKPAAASSTLNDEAALQAELTQEVAQSLAKKQAPPEPLQNGLKNKDESGIFSPLRDVTTGVFSSTINTASPVLQSTTTHTTERQPPTTPTDQNGYPAPVPRREKLPQVTRQPLTLTASTSHTARRPVLTSVSGNDVNGGKLEQNKRDVDPEKEKPPTVKTDDRRTSVKSLARQPPSQMPVVKNERNLNETNERDADEMSSNASAITKSSPSLAIPKEVASNSSPQPSQTKITESGPGFQQFQVQFMKNLIDDSLDEFRLNIHRDIVNLQVEMLRQFQLQQNEMKSLLQQYSQNNSLVEENERLREEIKRLKATH